MEKKIDTIMYALNIPPSGNKIDGRGKEDERFKDTL
jgi:hypothetical protein